MPVPPARPARIAHVIQNLNYGGMERILHCLARRLPPLGFEVHIVVLQYRGRFAEGLSDCATIHQVERMSRLSLLRPSALIRVLRQIGPHVVHSHSGVWLKTSVAARAAGRLPTIHTDHGRASPVPLPERLSDGLASRLTDLVVAVSDPLAEVLRREVVHDPSRVRVVPNGVEVAPRPRPADRARLRADLGLPADALVIGSVGRLEPVKNYALALRALARLRGDSVVSSGPILVLAGDGSERPQLEALAATLSLGSNVRFLGWRDDADQLYPAFDLFTLTSHSEGTSVSLLEAMGAGICPVVTDVGGNRAVLGPELARLLVPPGDDAALAASWQRYLPDAPGREVLASRARERVQRAYSLDAMVSQYAALYAGLIARRSEQLAERQ